MLGGPLSFHLSRYLYVCIDNCRFLVNIKNVNFLMRTQWPIFVKLAMWVVGALVLPTWSVVTECAYLTPYLHICSDRLISKKSNIQSSVWANWWNLVCGSWWAQVLPMWSVVTECAYLIPHLHICTDWLITNKSSIQSFVWATLM